ncbi:hypothetical protein C496_23121 [Natronorubrum tibetense GA33]|uniref:Uncharacterized protein n=1 Tax=Natronorubrum tibetense GA33 TaxID=1114856 RepID=L9VEP3_9EURY|nr:hypothetical protein C496_23121 [Natronorubrum tibetense GA33]
MNDDIQSEDSAIEVAKGYANEECIGELGEIIDARREVNEWIVEFRTHTLSEAYDHCVRLTASVGNVVSHERSTNLE